MEKCLFNNLEDGGTYQFRSSEFMPVAEYKKMLAEFDKMYESYQNSPSLFSIFGDDKIVIIADTYKLNFFADAVDEYDPEAARSYLKENGISDFAIDLICQGIESEEGLYIANIAVSYTHLTLPTKRIV